MSARQVLSAEEYQNIERRIDSYILRISNNEADAALREESIEKLERYLEKFHHYGSGFKNWLYSKMNGAVTTKANEDLTDLWTAYQAASVTAKMAGVKNTYNEERASRAAAGPINFNMLLTNDGHSAPQTGNYDHSYMTRGRPVYSANTQPHNGSPASGVFEYNSSGHNSVASSYHSQQGPLYYNAPQMTGMPPAPRPPPAQTQYQGNAFPRGPVGHQGQGMYYGGQGTSYPPQSGPWAGQGAHQGQGGPYHQ